MQGYLTRTFEPGRLQFTYEGFDETKWVAALTPFIDEKTDCRYRKGKDRPVTMRELAILYFALAKSQGSRPKTVFSISQVQDAFRKVTGNGISRNKASGLLRILTDKQIIARVGGYVPGMRGSTWKVRQPE